MFLSVLLFTWPDFSLWQTPNIPFGERGCSRTVHERRSLKAINTPKWQSQPCSCCLGYFVFISPSTHWAYMNVHAGRPSYDGQISAHSPDRLTQQTHTADSLGRLSKQTYPRDFLKFRLWTRRLPTFLSSKNVFITLNPFPSTSVEVQESKVRSQKFWLRALSFE